MIETRCQRRLLDQHLDVAGLLDQGRQDGLDDHALPEAARSQRGRHPHLTHATAGERRLDHIATERLAWTDRLDGACDRQLMNVAPSCALFALRRNESTI